MKKFILIQYLLFLPILLFAQDEGISISVNEDGSDQLTITELQSVQSASEKIINQYAKHGSLIDRDQHRITYPSIEAFKDLFADDATLLIDFLMPPTTGTVEEYIQLARTYYEREGIPFELNDAVMVSARYLEDCNCYYAFIQLNKTLHHYYSDGSWIYEQRPLQLEFKMQIDKETLDAHILSIDKAPEPTVQQRSQHTTSLLGGTSFFTGSPPTGFEVSSPYSLGLSYQFIQPLKFLGNAISLFAGVQLNYSQIKTNVQQGTTLRIDENVAFNSVTDIEFLTAGEEIINSLAIEPQIGLDLQLLEKVDKQLGLVLIFSPRFSISETGTFTGALRYEETFNQRVTVSNIINCGLRDFQGADAINAEYDTNLYNAGIGFKLAPYYQFTTGNRSGLRIGLDFQYYLSSMYGEGGRFLGNYNDANNPDTSENPALNMNGSSLLQTIGQDLSEFYAGIRLGYFFTN